MPELTRFYGLIIRMFAEAGERHHRPHFHVVSPNGEAVFAIDDLTMLAGTLPMRERRLVEAWAELHRLELADNWDRLQAGGRVAPIEPLRQIEAMTHPLHHLVAFKPAGNYRLWLRFDDDVERIIDFEPVLWGDLYGPLRDPEMFRTVRLDPEFKTLVWQNGADFDPSILHDWPEHERAWHELAARWRAAAAQHAPA